MTRILRTVAVPAVLLAVGAPVAAQADSRAEPLAAAIRRAIAADRLSDAARARILLDTLRSAIDPRSAARLARELGLAPGVSEAHCRRFLVDGEVRGSASYWPPIGYEVRGVDAILTIWHTEFAGDSAHVWITIARGSGRYIGAPTSYIVRRDSAHWRAEPYLAASPHGICHSRLFTAPLALAAQTTLADLRAIGPTCLDPTGFPLHEQDSVAHVLGAQVRGHFFPLVGGETPEPARDPCERDSVQWGGIVKFLRVDWEADDLIHVTVEARIPADQTSRRIGYTLRETDGAWSIQDQTQISVGVLSSGEAYWNSPDEAVSKRPGTARRPMRVPGSGDIDGAI
jgi:hypothetical protein